MPAIGLDLDDHGWGKTVADKGKVEASLLYLPSQLVLEKEKLDAMQAHLARKMSLNKDPSVVSKPQLRCEPQPRSKHAQPWKTSPLPLLHLPIL